MSLITTDGDGVSRLAAGLARAATDVVPGDAVAVTFESPRNPDFGDFATNVALQLAKRARRSPMDLANEIVAKLFDNEPGLRDLVTDVTPVAGFINVRMAPAHWHRSVAAALAEGPDYGRSAPTGERVSLEFGSANPTGPLVVVQGRTLSIGDSLANAMRFAGIDVTTEWIINDAGSQLDTLGRSLYARYRQIADPTFPFPEGGYPGDYLLPIAESLRAEHGDAYDAAPEDEWLPYFAKFGRDTLVAGQHVTCDRFGARFDHWQSEKELHLKGAVEAGVEALRERGLIYERDGAQWVRATDYGDDKDRVIVRSDGRPTYYGGDVAYHHDKLSRADRAILILGPDHHGYIARLRLIASTLGKPGAIEVMLAQQMTLVRDGEEVSLSKREGSVLTLDEVIDEVGVDAARFFFAALNSDSPMRFDLSLAKEQTNDNPVYYVQYGHARISSIVRKAPPALVERAKRGEALERLVEPAEVALARRISELPAVVRSVVDGRAPSRLARYAQTIASDFTQFYVAHKVLVEDEDLSTARLALAEATRTVLATALRLLGVTAPESM